MAGTLPQRHSIQRADGPNEESEWKKDGKQNLLVGVQHSRLLLQDPDQATVITSRTLLGRAHYVSSQLDSNRTLREKIQIAAELVISHLPCYSFMVVTLFILKIPPLSFNRKKKFKSSA